MPQRYPIARAVSRSTLALVGTTLQPAWMGFSAGAAFDEVFTSAGIEVLKIPPRSPRAHAYAERWVRTIRSKVTDRMLITATRHLRAVLDEYAAHHNRHRPHRALSLRPPGCDDITMAPVTNQAAVRIRRREVLGGLIHEYERAA